MKKNFVAKRILIASDHAGFSLKEFLKKEFDALGFEVLDLGCNSSEESVDYPDYAQKLCNKLPKNLTENSIKEFGILICGSGIGIAIAANRFKHVRAALCYNQQLAKLSRAHNNANVLCLGARHINGKKALSIAKAFLKAKFEGERHERRVKKLGDQ